MRAWIIAAVLSGLAAAPAWVSFGPEAEPETAMAHPQEVVLLDELIVEPRATRLSFDLLVPQTTTGLRVELDWQAGHSIPLLVRGPGSCGGVYLGPADDDLPAGPSSYDTRCRDWSIGEQTLGVDTRGAVAGTIRVIATTW